MFGGLLNFEKIIIYLPSFLFKSRLMVMDFENRRSLRSCPGQPFILWTELKVKSGQWNCMSLSDFIDVRANLGFLYN